MATPKPAPAPTPVGLSNTPEARLARLQASGSNPWLQANLQKQIQATPTPAPKPAPVSSVIQNATAGLNTIKNAVSSGYNSVAQAVQPAPTPTPAPRPTPTPAPAPVSSPAGTTVNRQTGEVFQNATEWPYTLQNAMNNGYVPDKAQTNQTANPMNVWKGTDGQYWFTTPATPQKAKAGAPVPNYNTSTGREAEIQSNIDTITAGNPNLLTNRNSFNASFGYATADAGKKALLDSAWLSKQPTADNVFNNLMSGVPAGAPVNSQAYKDAKLRYSTVQKFTGMNSTQLWQAMKTGMLLPWTSTYNDLMKDPKVKANLDKANALNTINGVTLDIEQTEKKVTNDIIDNSPLGQALKDGYISPDEADQLTTTPEIKAKREEITKLKTDYDTQKAYYDNIRVDVEKELKWTGATQSQIYALIGSRERDMKVGLDIATATYNNSIGALADMKSTMAKNFDLNMNLYQKRQDAQTARENMQYQADLSLKTDQRKFEQQMAQESQLASDPTQATKKVLDTYAKMGIIPQRSEAEIIQSIQDQVAQGVPLGQAITELNKQFQSKPEYKRVMEVQRWQLSDREKMALSQQYNLQNQSVWQQYDLQKMSVQDQMATQKILLQSDLNSASWKQDAIDKMVMSGIDPDTAREVVNAGYNGSRWSYNGEGDSVTTIQTASGKNITMNSQPAQALKWLLDSNPDIKVDHGNMYRTQEDQYKLLWKWRTPAQMAQFWVPPDMAKKYSNPSANQVTWTAKSKHMSGMAVDVVNPTPDVVRRMNQAGFYQPDDPWMRKNDSGHFEYTGKWAPSVKSNKSLSTGAKQAMNTKTIDGTPTQREKIANELYEAGVLNDKTGNKNYYMKSEKEKQAMLSTIKAKESIDKVKAIYDKHVKAGDANEFLWWYDQFFIGAKRWVGMSTEFTKDYTEMERILGKELSNYMSQISGATVGDKEVDRLKKQMPGLDMNEEQFKQSLEDYSNTLQSTEDFIYQNNGFQDRASFYKTAGVKWQSQPQNTQKSSADAQNKMKSYISSLRK